MHAFVLSANYVFIDDDFDDDKTNTITRNKLLMHAYIEKKSEKIKKKQSKIVKIIINLFSFLIF